MNQWVLISDVPPQFDKLVLVSVHEMVTPYVTIARLVSLTEDATGKRYKWVDKYEDDFVSSILYWMPLPEPATLPESTTKA